MNLKKGQITEKRIIGHGKNLYLINWSRSANFGYDLVLADTEDEAYKDHLFSLNEDVDFIVTKISRRSLPIIYKKEENIIAGNVKASLEKN